MPFVIMMLALCVGRYYLSPHEVFAALLHGPHAENDPAVLVVYKSRLPRILLAFLIGAGLSVTGCCFQSIFSNSLASPDTLGVSSGAAFGAALGILIYGSLALVQGMAIAFGIIAIGVTFLLSRCRGDKSVLMIVLAGVISSAFFNAMISAIKYIADPLSKLPEITYWLMGSMRGASYKDLTLAVPLIGVPVLLLFFLRWRLNILILPEDEAISLGVNVKRLRWTIILLCTLIVAACVSTCGQVGWVGLVIPHMVRKIVGTNHNNTLPACISLGGTYLLMIDVLARTITAGEIPLSVLTAVIGVPLFAVLFFRRDGAHV